MKVPCAAALWDALTAAPACEHEPAEIFDLLAALHRSNQAQWAAENAARRATDDHGLAVAKRTIDECNARRVVLIEAMNAAFAECFPPTHGAPPVTCQPGSICDQLSVLRLRLDVVVRDLTDDGCRTAEVREAAAGLLAAFDADMRDVTAGRRSLRAIPIHKVYESP